MVPKLLDFLDNCEKLDWFNSRYAIMRDNEKTAVVMQLELGGEWFRIAQSGIGECHGVCPKTRTAPSEVTPQMTPRDRECGRGRTTADGDELNAL
jgi:hypothetical protein